MKAVIGETKSVKVSIIPITGDVVQLQMVAVGDDRFETTVNYLYEESLEILRDLIEECLDG